jgi:MFS transporter, FSR family, fosmidomycin resistance protein
MVMEIMTFPSKLSGTAPARRHGCRHDILMLTPRAAGPVHSRLSLQTFYMPARCKRVCLPCPASMPNPLETRWIDAVNRAIVRGLPGTRMMTEATERLAASRHGYARIVGVVSAAHFVSHYYILLLPPLFPFVRAEYGVSYTQLGLALAAFNVVSALLQTPTGFLVDWLGARILLIVGLLFGGAAFMAAGLVNSFWVLVAMFALAGVGNTVYHPADYALLSHHVPSARIGQAFSIHTFAGMLGSAVAPGSLLLMQTIWGWRGAFIGAGALGLAAAALLLVMSDEPEKPAAPVPAQKAEAVGWRLLLAPPILLNLGFFLLLAIMNGGMYNYSVVALGALEGTPLATANGALSGHLLLSAFGVLIGGVVATRTAHHGLVATLGLAAIAAFTVLIAYVDLGSWPLVLVMAITGFFFGVIMPSRDMLVREVTPPGSFGKVFGFVTTGFNLGGIVSPLVFGAIMDQGSPRLVFLGVAACGLAAIATVATLPRRAG